MTVCMRHRQTKKPAATLTLACTLTCILRVENVLTHIQLRRYFVEGYTPHLRYQATTRKRYTEKDHISFVPVTYRTPELTAKTMPIANITH
jgi:hypothetical protein